MGVRIEPLPVSVPDLRAFRWSTDGLHAGMKAMYAVGRVESGRSSFWCRGKTWTSEPGSLLFMVPGDICRDVARDGPGSLQVVAFPPHVVEGVAGRVQVPLELRADDGRGAAFRRLHDAVRDGADSLALAVAVAEAIGALTALEADPFEPSLPVRRAVELLHERLAGSVTLDELAAHAGLDKFRLCRAFRAQVGLPPYAYLTQLRIRRARQLLAAGVRPGEVAPQVGLYDQSQLNRHFRRIVGTTPGAYARRA